MNDLKILLLNEKKDGTGGHMKTHREKLIEWIEEARNNALDGGRESFGGVR